MFKRHYQKRSPSIVFVIFRLVLSMGMFAVLIVGIYAAYKHFSGLDPLKLDPQAVIRELLAGGIPKNFSQKILGQQNSSKSSSESLGKFGSINPVFRFLLVADSHNDNVNLKKAISQAKQTYQDLKFIIGLGDYTDVGTVAELKDAKAIFDGFGLRYFLIPGDHDLWDCRNRSLPPVSCFKQVFGPAYQTFIFNSFKFLLLDNSDNYTGVDNEQLKWIADELEKTKQAGIKGIFVFIHTPLYHPSSDHVMGWVEKALKIQAGMLVFQLKDAGVTEVFSGDIHYFSQYNEPKINISMATIGAVGINRNPQSPRFAVVSVFEDGSTKVEDVEIK